MDDRTEKQLGALAEVAALLDAAAIECWLFGGWAVDFHVGAVTREHDDVDLAIWLDDSPRIDALLKSDGWRHVPFPDEDGGTGYHKSGVRLEVTYLVRNDDGHVCVALSSGPAVFSEAPLGDVVGELRGVRSRMIGLDLLRRGKGVPRGGPREEAKDRADLAQLTRLAP